jgi:hypothetical protein
VLNELLGFKFKLVSGFQSSADVFLAMERGRGRWNLRKSRQCQQSAARLDFGQESHRSVAGRATPHPDLKDVPNAF